MARKWKIAIAALAVAVLIGVLSFHGLRQRVERLSQAQSVEEQARREVLAPPITTPTDVTVAAKIFWAAGAGSACAGHRPIAALGRPGAAGETGSSRAD